MNHASQPGTAMIRSRSSNLLMQVVIFRLDQERYAVPINQVQEVMICSQVARAFEMPHGIVGILNLRGTIIPIGDLRQRLGVIGQPPEEQQILVCRLDPGVSGFIVDEVLQVMKIPRQDIKAPPASITAHAPVPVLGVATVGSRLITIIDLAAAARVQVQAQPQLAGAGDAAITKIKQD